MQPVGNSSQLFCVTPGAFPCYIWISVNLEICCLKFELNLFSSWEILWWGLVPLVMSESSQANQSINQSIVVLLLEKKSLDISPSRNCLYFINFSQWMIGKLEKPLVVLLVMISTVCKWTDAESSSTSLHVCNNWGELGVSDSEWKNLWTREDRRRSNTSRNYFSSDDSSRSRRPIKKSFYRQSYRTQVSVLVTSRS